MTAEEEFDPGYFERLEAARGHWWVLGMQRVGGALLAAAPGVTSGGGLSVLDAGCGSGNLLPWLAELAGPARVRAIDFAAPALANCRRAGLDADFVQASVTALPIPDSTMDLVVSMDVLQHLTSAQERAALEEVVRVLRPGGRFLVRTNSGMGRSRVPEREDWRLYRPGSLRSALVGAGLEVQTLTPVNFLQGLWASIPRPRRAHGDHTLQHSPAHEAHQDVTGRPISGLSIPAPVGRVRNRLLFSVVQAEAWWLSRPGRSLPFGHSLYAVARRPLTASEG